MRSRAACPGGIDRRQRRGDVVEHLSEDAATPDHGHRSEPLIAADSDDQLHTLAGVDHLLDRHGGRIDFILRSAWTWPRRTATTATTATRLDREPLRTPQQA